MRKVVGGGNKQPYTQQYKRALIIVVIQKRIIPPYVPAINISHLYLEFIYIFSFFLTAILLHLVWYHQTVANPNPKLVRSF